MQAPRAKVKFLLVAWRTKKTLRALRHGAKAVRLAIDSRKRPVSAMRPGVFVFGVLGTQTQEFRMARVRRRSRVSAPARA